LRILQVN